ncbi:two component transcriptional regulator, LuxR family [Modestobacter sp. DSM 44400]|uniref:response regulator n=1 Tax=Modestobacter sp. DSM 44400 TaxID=1550230 RepID=UPI00089BE479|nr:response regulator transcription factor [Modestobacter sp. DSM 44400]SDY83511.1 two component transcriptional regulator, LuxR family [Modestobacter sp. DSM 44400]
MRVTLADDGVLFREGMARILAEIGFTIVDHVRDGASLVECVRADPPDVVITDLRMPPGFADEGIEAASAIRSFAPEVGLMLLSQYVEVHHALRLMNEFAGGVGYLLKDRVSDLGAFATDVRRVGAGDVVIDTELAARLIGRPRRHDPLARLSEREREVLGLMASGLSNAALSEELHVSPKTVEGYVSSIFIKLDLTPGERENRRVIAVLRFLREQ